MGATMVLIVIDIAALILTSLFPRSVFIIVFGMQSLNGARTVSHCCLLA